MFRLIAENPNGEQMELTNNPAYVITNIDGLNPPDATINMIDRAGRDGSTFNSAKVNVRQIILDIAINGSACDNRNNLYKYFQTARKVRLYYYNDIHEVYIDAYVQNAPVEFFTKKETVQITLICPDPFWHGITDIEGRTNGVEALFSFPFSIETPIPFSDYYADHSARLWNPGSVESGILIEIEASGAVTNPLIFHVNSDKYFRVNTTLQSGDKLAISTKLDNKYITLTRGTAKTNLIASRDLGSTWLRAVPGENVFTLKAASGVDNMNCLISFKSNLEGV